MSPRAYDGSARRFEAEARRDRALDVALEMAESSDPVDITLDAVAKRAGISVQTLIRQLESKDGLFAAAFARARVHYAKGRRTVVPGDARGVVRAQMGIYERWGRAMIRLRAEQDRWPVVRAELDKGRKARELWLETMFADAIGRSEHPRAMRAQLFVLTDVLTWVALRVDQGASRALTEQCMVAMLEAVVTHAT